MKWVACTTLLVCTVVVAHATIIDFGRNMRDTTPNTFTRCYGVVFDAGSSGTRVYVYKWECRKTKSTPQVQITERIPEQSVRGGLSKFKTNPAEAGPSLVPLINFAKTVVPQDQWSWTPIFLRATAGLRLVTPEQQAAILESVRLMFEKSAFMFEDESWARVVTGTEEGAFGWVATNYLNNKFNKKVKPDQTRAMIECGGASVQITFYQPPQPPKNKIVLNFEDINRYDLYTYSFLGYGQDQARNEVIKASIINPNDDFVKCSCFHKGFNSTNTYSANPLLRVEGTGNIEECTALIKSMFKLNPDCRDCSIGGEYLPDIPAGMNIDALSVFVYVSDFYKLGSEYSPNALISKTNDFCAMDWSDVIKTHKVDEFLSGYCFNGIYINQLLTSAFRINPNTTISAKGKIGDVTVAWTLGSILYDMSTLKCKPGTEDCIYDDNNLVKILTWTFSSVLGVGVLLIIVTVVITAVRRRRRQKSYATL